MFENLDLENIIMLIQPEILEDLLRESSYDPSETRFLVQGFKKSFDIQYKGPTNRQSKSRNIPFLVGDKVELWNKIMKDVKKGAICWTL